MINRSAANEYRTLGAQDQPAVYVTVDEPPIKNVPEMAIRPPFPGVPIIVESGDPKAPTVPHNSPATIRRDVRRLIGEEILKLNIDCYTLCVV